MSELSDIHAGRILIVDDNAVNISIMEKILRHEGYCQIDATCKPVKVLQMHHEHQYDLILLDVHMPSMNGLEVMARLREAYPDDYLPILMLTADLSVETRNQCLSAGAKDFIGKPFDRTEIALRVRNILHTSQLHKELKQKNAELEARVKERTDQLFEAQTKVIQCLGKAAEYRDNETGMHVIRMSKSCGMLAREMGLNEAECELLLRASPMHDIGKIAIPDEVLLKPGVLTPEEWDTMKTHAEVGAEILGGYSSELMQTAALIARTHHERWDGKGYPEGLAGEAIPVYTRIVSVCDVFDALTSERPYKKAWSVKEAIDYLHDQSGAQFDPVVVDKFTNILEPILSLRVRYPDVGSVH